MTIRLVYNQFLQCYKSDKNWERFYVNFKQLQFLLNCSPWTPKCCTQKPIRKFRIFCTGSLFDGFTIVKIYMMQFPISVN